MAKARAALRLTALAATGALALAACGGSGDDGGAGDTSASAHKGGTLTILTLNEQLDHIDPQRAYTGEDLAFLSGYLTRTLTAYKLSKDGKTAGELVGDLASDTGTATDGGKTWTFALRSGAKWEDGSDVTCADIKYGISRTFAQSVVSDGPTYAIQLLDVPKDKDGNPTYKGPYETANNDTAGFDKAIECAADGSTITFHLAVPTGDFNYAVTMPAFAAVPKAKDTGEKYDENLVSDGPYKVAEYTKGQQLVLERNPAWKEGVDGGYRGAYPDKVVMKFAVQQSVISQRMIADAGDDQHAIMREGLDTASLSTVFNDPRFEKRRINELDPYVRYIAINTTKVPNLKHRQAILAAADREQIRTIAGGSFGGDLADGVIKPNLAADYAPTGLWDGLLGEAVPPTGNVELAKKLIAESGAPMPVLTFDYGKTPDTDKIAASLQASLKRAGITVKLNPIENGKFYSTVLDPKKENELVRSGWGPDWLNASTVIPPLFTPDGGFDLSRVNDKEFNAKVQAAKAELDRGKQAAMWQELNKYAMQQAWMMPTRGTRIQRLNGSKVGSASGENGRPYLWAPYGSWSYADLYVTQ